MNMYRRHADLRDHVEVLEHAPARSSTVAGRLRLYSALWSVAYYLHPLHPVRSPLERVFKAGGPLADGFLFLLARAYAVLDLKFPDYVKSISNPQFQKKIDVLYKDTLRLLKEFIKSNAWR